VQAYRQGDGHLLLVDAVTQRAWDVDERSGRVDEVTLLDTSLARAQAKAVRSYAPQNEAIFVEIHKPVTASATMKVRKFVVNPDIPDTLFQISPPPGYEDQGC
jgi:hypothetical protein